MLHNHHNIHHIIHHIIHQYHKHVQHDEYVDEHKYRDHLGRAYDNHGAYNYRGRAVVCRK